MDPEREPTDAEIKVLVPYLLRRIELVEHQVSDHAQRFDTLQTPLWKRLLFRLDGWPGQRNLNAEQRSRRPWH